MRLACSKLSAFGLETDIIVIPYITDVKSDAEFDVHEYQTLTVPASDGFYVMPHDGKIARSHH